MQRVSYIEILRALVERNVEFVVAGGVAAVMQGAPLMTFDLDLVHSTHPANVERLLAALETMHARYRSRPDLKPHASHLSSPGHQLLITDHGPLDLLGHIGRGRSYRDLLPRTVQIEVAPGLTVRALDLETLIATKEEAGGEKDKSALPLLRRTLEERARASRPPESFAAPGDAAPCPRRVQ